MTNEKDFTEDANALDNNSTSVDPNTFLSKDEAKNDVIPDESNVASLSPSDSDEYDTANEEFVDIPNAYNQKYEVLTIELIEHDAQFLNLPEETAAEDQIDSVYNADEEPQILPPDEIFSDFNINRTEKENPVEEEFLDSQEYIEPLYEQFSIPELEYSNEEYDETEETDEPIENETYNPEKPRKIDGKFDFLELFIFTLVTVMIITTFFFRHSIVDGVSMENTLVEGEHLIISDVFYMPKRGDIIVCEDHTTAISKPIVKRVIATAGETVFIVCENGENKVYIDGVLLNEPYVNIDDPTYKYMPLKLTVPDGEIFVMGDHRNESTDSRAIGTVSVDSVLGRVLIRFYPFDKFGKVD